MTEASEVTIAVGILAALAGIGGAILGSWMTQRGVATTARIQAEQTQRMDRIGWRKEQVRPILEALDSRSAVYEDLQRHCANYHTDEAIALIDALHIGDKVLRTVPTKGLGHIDQAWDELGKAEDAYLRLCADIACERWNSGEEKDARWFEAWEELKQTIGSVRSVIEDYLYS